MAAMRLPQLSIRGRLDRAGMVLSGLCALHCVAGIVLVAVLGIGGGILLNPVIHRVGLAAARSSRRSRSGSARSATGARRRSWWR